MDNFQLYEISAIEFEAAISQIEPANTLTHCNNPELANILNQSFNFQAHYFKLSFKSQIAALFWIHKVGNKQISLPHFSYHSISINKELQAESSKIFTRISDLLIGSEIRAFEPYSPYYTNHKVSSWLPLEDNIDGVWNNFSSNLRRKIRKSIKNKLNIQSYNNNCPVEEQEQALLTFHSIYRKRLKQMGSPHLGLSFFRLLLSSFNDGNSTIFVVRLGEEPIGVAFNLSYRGFTENGWFATLPQYNHLYPSYLLHWKGIESAVSQKQKIYSFGRSTVFSSGHHYKKQWGGKDIRLFWSFDQPAKSNILYLPKLKFLWKITPKLITNTLGPHIASRLY